MVNWRGNEAILIRTFLDTGVLLAATRSSLTSSEKALAILDDPNREFATSVFVRLETEPKARYNNFKAEAEFYSAFFKTAVAGPYDLNAAVERAGHIASKFGLAPWMHCMLPVRSSYALTS